MIAYLTEFFLEWELFQKKETKQIFYFVTFPRKLCHLWENVGKYGAARQATDDNTTRPRDSIIQIHTHNIQYWLLFHINNGNANAPQCCVIHALPILQFLTNNYVAPTKRTLLKKPPAADTIKKLPVFYVSRRFTAVTNRIIAQTEYYFAQLSTLHNYTNTTVSTLNSVPYTITQA